MLHPESNAVNSFNQKNEIDTAAQAPPVRITCGRPVCPDLAERPQWSNWQYKQRDGRWTKVPFQGRQRDALPGERPGLHWFAPPAKSNDSSTWMTLRDAMKLPAAAQQLERFGLFFFCLPQADPAKNIVVIDLDDCRDRHTGALTARATEIISKFDTYTEVSPSGTGVKLFVFGHKPGQKCKNSLAEIEIYDRLRGLAITNSHLPGTPERICLRQAELNEFYYDTFPGERPEEKARQESERAARRGLRPATQSGIPQGELLRKALTWPKFSALFNGQSRGSYPSDSEFDWALIGSLGWLTRDDEQAMRSLIRQSPAARPRWFEARGDVAKIDYEIRRFLDSGGSRDFYGSDEWRSNSWLKEWEDLAGLGELPEELERNLFGTKQPAVCDQCRKPQIESQPQATQAVTVATGSLDLVIESLRPAPEPTIDSDRREEERKQASREARRERPVPIRCHVCSANYHPEKKKFRVLQLACGRWCCLNCAEKLKTIWSTHLTNCIRNRKQKDKSLYALEMAGDEKTWWRFKSYMDALRKKLGQRSLGNYVRIKTNENSILVVSTVKWSDECQNLTTEQAVELVCKAIRGLQIYGDTRKPISTSAGWRRPEKETSGWKFVGSLPRHSTWGEVIQALERMGLSPQQFHTTMPFFPRGADCSLPLSKERSDQEGWWEQVMEWYRKLLDQLNSIDGLVVEPEHEEALFSLAG